MKAIKNWFKLKSIQEIQVFIRFAKFYYYFIYSFSKISTFPILILKTSLVINFWASITRNNNIENMKNIKSTSKIKNIKNLAKYKNIIRNLAKFKLFKKLTFLISKMKLVFTQ